MKRLLLLPALGFAAALAMPGAGAPARPLTVDPGQRLFLQCQACHSIDRGGAAKIGPNLWGIYGSPAASRPGFAYSAALKGAKLTWDDATLDKWLTRPGVLVPGTKMIFIGIADPAQRQRLIAYLKRSKG